MIQTWMTYIKNGLLLTGLACLSIGTLNGCSDREDGDSNSGNGTDDGSNAVGGECTVTSCLSTFPGTGKCCGDACTDTSNDENNCGLCGNSCGVGQTCLGGVCQSSCSPSCSGGDVCCGAQCVDTTSDPLNCNGCGLACDDARSNNCGSDPLNPSISTCLCGTDAQCSDGWGCVQALDGVFGCVDLQLDPNNCGEVGRVCEGTCTNGECTCGNVVCQDNESCCSGVCVDTNTSADNCGVCDLACGGNASSCIAGQCQCGTEVCRAPSPGDPGQMCCGASGVETCIERDETACRDCNTPCGPLMCFGQNIDRACMLGTKDIGSVSSPQVCCGANADFDLGGIPGLPSIAEGLCLDLDTGIAATIGAFCQ